MPFMSVPFTLLHLSDLHFGPHCRFRGQDMKRLAEAVSQAVRSACEMHDLGERVDLVVVTGDVAEAARPPEYREAAAFFGALGGALGLEPARFVFVPGNHDVSWTRCQRVHGDHADGIIDEAERDRQVHVEKFKFFDGFLREVYGHEREAIDGVTRLRHGAWLYDVPSLGLSLAALNSCERETDKVHGGQLGATQAQRLMDHWRQPARARQPVRIVALHHNPVATVPANISYSLERLVERAKTDALDADMVEHFRADSFGIDDSGYLHAIATDCQVQLVLHGHHHASVRHHAWNWTKGGPGQTQILSAGSWGLEQAHLPADEGVVVHLVRVEPERPALRSLLLRYEPGLRQSGQVVPGAFATAHDGVVELTLSLPRGLPERKAAPAPAPAVDSGLVGAYRRAFAGTLNQWDLAVGAHHIGARPPGDMPGLDDMYQPLRLAADVERGMVRWPFAQDRNPDEPGAVIDPAALLAREQPLIVRGPAGAGKTTWLRWTFRSLLDASKHPDALPLFIELRALVRAWEGVPEKDRTLDGYLAIRLAAVMGEGYRARLAEAVPAWLVAAEGPRPVLFIDGWDEAGSLGRDLREKLLALLRLHPRVLAVVTSRPYGQEPPTTADGFERLDVQPLSDRDIAALTERFYREVYREPGPAASEACKRFLRALRAAPTARELAGSPLLLTMMLAIHRSRPLPDKRHHLYRACIDTLLSDRPERKQAEGARAGRHVWCPPDRDVRRRAVQGLAYAMMSGDVRADAHGDSGTIAVSPDEAARVLPDDWDERNRHGFLRWLVEVAGLLVDRSDDTLTFTHLSFQEYLAACHLLDTADGVAPRLDVCRERARAARWWETLRLWAAELHGRNPGHLTPVLEALVSGTIFDGLSADPSEQQTAEAAGFWLAGAMFADDTGADEAFAAWTGRLAEHFYRRDESWADQTARAWAACQSARRQALSDRWSTALARCTWQPWLFAEDWQRRAAINAHAVPGPRAAAVLQSRDAKHASVPEVLGLGRVWSGATPWWPVQSLEVSLLRLWPGARPLLGMRLQRMSSLGASRADMCAVTPGMLARSLSEDASRRNLARSLAQRLARDFARDLVRYSARDLARHFAGDSARYFTGDSARYLARDSALDLVRYLARDSARYLARDWARDFVRILARDLDARAPYHFARDWAQVRARNWVGNVARDWALPLAAPWVEDAVSYEYLSALGQSSTRATVAHTRSEGEPLLELFGPACRASLRQAPDTPELTAALAAHAGTLDPLWPALARHIARCATDEDRDLLEHLARHPDEREPPLSWGLQYYVRGDVLFFDGESYTSVTLDDLCAEAGIDPPPYLEPMPDEIDLDDAD
jgi:3',5'-cyclic AMP phosphodiesterase CpdA